MAEQKKSEEWLIKAEQYVLDQSKFIFNIE